MLTVGISASASRFHWLMSAGIVITAFWMAQACGDDPATRMKQAHDGRAVWKNFPGFSAQLVAQKDSTTVSGRIDVSPEGAIDLKLEDNASQADIAWLERALDSVIGHRLASSEAISNVEFADDHTQHPFGRLIRSKDPQEHSLWRVKGDVLTEVHRINEKTHFVISVADVARNAEGLHLPQNFTVETWDRATGRLTKSRQVHTSWQRFGTLDLPTEWWAVTNSDGEARTVERIEFRDHQVTAPVRKVTSTTSN